MKMFDMLNFWIYVTSCAIITVTELLDALDSHTYAPFYCTHILVLYNVFVSYFLMIFFFCVRMHVVFVYHVDVCAT